MSGQPQRGLGRKQARTGASAINGRALLARITSVLIARGVDVATQGEERLCVGSQPVAHVTKTGAVRVHPVRDGIDPQLDVKGFEGYQRAPTGEPEQASTIALDIQVRLVAWAKEERRGLAARGRVTQPDLTGALLLAEQRMLAAGVRGTYDVDRRDTFARVEWSSSHGSALRVEQRALRVAEEVLVAAGFDAQVVLGLGWVRVSLTAASVANEPTTHEDAVHNGEPAPETLTECLIDQAAE